MFLQRFQSKCSLLQKSDGALSPKQCSHWRHRTAFFDPILKPLYLQGEKAFLCYIYKNRLFVGCKCKLDSKISQESPWPSFHHISQSFCHSLCEKCPYSVLFCSSFSAFGLNSIQSKYGKMWTRITPNTDTFYAVIIISQLSAADGISQVKCQPVLRS